MPQYFYAEAKDFSDAFSPDEKEFFKPPLKQLDGLCPAKQMGARPIY